MLKQLPRRAVRLLIAFLWIAISWPSLSLSLLTIDRYEDLKTVDGTVQIPPAVHRSKAGRRTVVSADDGSFVSLSCNPGGFGRVDCFDADALKSLVGRRVVVRYQTRLDPLTRDLALEVAVADKGTVLPYDAQKKKYEQMTRAPSTLMSGIVFFAGLLFFLSPLFQRLSKKEH